MRLLPIALLLLASTASAGPLTCAADATTAATICFNPREVREVAGIRTVPYYAGGPLGVSRTPYTLAVNCAAGVIHMRDQRGVSFGGADAATGTTMSRQLTTLVCYAGAK